MANTMKKHGNNIDFIHKLESLQAVLSSLLREVALQTQPVRIEPHRGIDFYDRVEKFEIQLIVSALEAAGGRQSRAAKLLKMRTSTLSSKMKQLKINRT